MLCNKKWVIIFTCVHGMNAFYLHLIHLAFLFSDSQPFQEFEKGATGRDLGEGAGLNALRLDDDNEFPPMTHKVD